MTTHLNETIKDWTSYQANLDPDRRQLFNELIQDLQKQHDMTANIDTDEILLSLIVELKRELEDVRNQLELARIDRVSEQAELPRPVQP